MNNLITLDHVSKSFKLGDSELKVLDDISFTIKKGEFVAIVGPSGSGKSTMLYLLGCLDRPTKGKILFDNEDLALVSEERLAEIRNQKIGFVFQMFNLLPRTSALANVLLPTVYNTAPIGNQKEKALKMLARVGLAERSSHFPNQLSGGEQQRVAIARALINNPELILADEPTGNLDSKSGAEILKIFHELHDEGKTIILITHDHEIAKLAERKLELKDGRLARNS